MSHISLTTSPNNPIRPSHVDEAIKLVSPELHIRPEELPDYTAILAGTHEVFERIAKLDDYVPSVNREVYPRENVHYPLPIDNPHNAWACKATVQASDPVGPLVGKSVCLKGENDTCTSLNTDNIALADVPCTVGTSFIDWIPVTDATVATRVLQAGGKISGKAVCENLSYFGASVSSATGESPLLRN